jgi:acyl-CoA thioester hydrolase
MDAVLADPQFNEPFSIELAVRPNDLDSLGHVNNAVVLEYLEAARWAWLARHKLPRVGSIIPIVARIEIDYRLEILPPKVVVTTVLENASEAQGSAAHRYQCIFRQLVMRSGADESRPAVEARVQVAFVDANERRLRSLEEYLSQPRDGNAQSSSKQPKQP